MRGRKPVETTATRTFRCFDLTPGLSEVRSGRIGRSNRHIIHTRETPAFSCDNVLICRRERKRPPDCNICSRGSIYNPLRPCNNHPSQGGPLVSL